MKCKICNSKTYEILDEQFNHIYHKCLECDFIFLDDKYYLNDYEEKDQYSRHNNTIDNEGYVDMFERFINFSIKPYLENGRILDFGSGPGPVLSVLLERHGYDVDIYDPYYAKNEFVFSNLYDLITSTEVFEHFYNPRIEIEKLLSILNSEGYLSLMTLFSPNTDEQFKNWWYRRDPTHVSFYSKKTFMYIAKIYNLELVDCNDKNIVILKKKGN